MKSLDELFTEGYQEDPTPNEIIQALNECTKRHAKVALAEYTGLNNQLYIRNRLFVLAHTPLKLKLIMEHHDKPSARYPVVAKTLELLIRQHKWFGMPKDIKQYLRNCHTCHRSKSRRHAPYGTLNPLAVPNRLWEDITVDFVKGLPESEGFNAIMMVVDSLGKLRPLIMCRDTVDAKATALLYLRHVWKHHGLTKEIVSDRGTVTATVM